MIDPDPRCAATFVNDAFGPNRDRAAKIANKAKQNVKFCILHDRSGFPHVFWRVVRFIPAGGTLWGDYGDAYWNSDETNEEDTEDPIYSALLRRMLYMLRGRSAAFPLVL